MRCILFVTALMLMACGDGDARNAAMDGDVAASAAPSTQVVHATITDTSIELSVDSVNAGPASFLIGNRGVTRHSLRILSMADSWSVSNIMSGGDATLRVDLSPGVYELFCPDFDGDGTHAGQGVYARLIVYDAAD